MAYATYELHFALAEDLNEGRVWIRNPTLKGTIDKRRPIVQITYKHDLSRVVNCEALYADDAYLRSWQENGAATDKKSRPSLYDLIGSMVMNRSDSKPGKAEQDWIDRMSNGRECSKNLIFISGWYRHRLFPEPVRACTEVCLDVTPDPSLYSLLWKFPRQHPQTVVLSSSMIGIIGTGLGIIGLGLGVIGVGLGLKDSSLVHLNVDLLAALYYGGLVVSLVGFIIGGIGSLGLVRPR